VGEHQWTHLDLGSRVTSQGSDDEQRGASAASLLIIVFRAALLLLLRSIACVSYADYEEHPYYPETFPPRFYGSHTQDQIHRQVVAAGFSFVSPFGPSNDGQCQLPIDASSGPALSTPSC
jgi:hypothetical protein